MRFNDDTTIPELLEAVEPFLQRLLERDEITEAQECFGATCEFARIYPESQTAADLLAWAHGQTPAGAVEAARAETIEEWVAPEDMEAYESLGKEAQRE